MKGVVIFSDDKADLAFFSLDKEMKKYILDRITLLEMEAAPDVDAADLPQKDIRDCLSAFLLPFFTSFGVLQTLRKPIFSITVEDGFLIVFRKFDEQVYIALSREEGDTEETLTKKLLVFNRIVTLLYGPVYTKLSSSDIQERTLVWNRLAAVYRTYENLYLTDQVYLIEALEHVQFGQLVTAGSVVQKLAREVMEPSHNGGIAGVRHVMILVNTKILTTYGRSPRLETADILLLILLVYHHFNHQDEEEETEEQEEAGVGNPPELTEDANEENGGSGDETRVEFKTPCSTPGQTIRSLDPDYESIDDLELGVPGETPVDVVDGRRNKPSASVQPTRASSTPEPVKRKPQALSLASSQLTKPSKLKSALASLLKRGANKDSLPTGAQTENEFFEQTVFLQPQKDQHVPHILYCYQVYQNIMLLMVADYQGASQIAGNICQILSNLTAVFGSNRHVTALNTGPATYDLIEDSLRRLKDQVVRYESETLNVQIGYALQAWKNMKEYKFKEYLEKRPSERSKGPDAQRNFTRMDACASSLKERLMKLFSYIYLSPRKKGYDQTAVVSKLSRVFATLNKDYSDFLSLKGEINIPMVSFSMQFPGMVHFIYIDRSFDDLMTPSLHTTGHVGHPYVERIAKKTGESGSVLLRRKIWNMVQRAQRFLGHGYTIQTWLDEDFLYVYFLWINIPHNPLGNPIRFYSLSDVRGGDYSQPGVIGSSFYAAINLKQGYMYELYAMFDTKISIKEASDHCRALAEQLWPSSKESVAPFILIT